MKTKAILPLFLVCLAVGLAGCGRIGIGKKLDADVMSVIAGDWDCEETASDEEAYTGYYHLRIDKNGDFSLYDQEAGNPGLDGKIKECNAQTPEGDAVAAGTITISFETDDFDPPACWDICDKDTLDYAVMDDGRLRLEYSDVWLNFYR